jgi:biotin-(acetyl-CoA carboxylase) ligase
LKEKFIQLKKFLTINQSPETESRHIEKLGSLVAKLAEDLEQQKTVSRAVASENSKIRREFEERVAELNEKLSSARLIEEQVAKIGEGVRRWQEDRVKLEARIAGFENFQKLLLEQSDEAILEFIKDVKRQLKEQAN